MVQKDKFSFEKTAAMLQERVKELNCIYSITNLIENEDSIEKIYEGIPPIIPPSWQYTQHTSAKLSVYGNEYLTNDFSDSPWFQESYIYDKFKRIGKLTVYYTKEFPALYEGPFLKEERSLLDNICKRLGKVIEKHQVNLELAEANKRLQLKNKTLDAKNIALRELLSQLEVEKRQIQKNAQNNIDSLILPMVENLNENNLSIYRNTIIKSLSDISSSFGHTLQNLFSALSPREIEICHLIEKGMSSKNIAETLSISYQTVIKHRYNIRNKLGICGEGKNLVNTLKAIGEFEVS